MPLPLPKTKKKSPQPRSDSPKAAQLEDSEADRMKISDRLLAKVSSRSASLSQNRSPDLVPLMSEYEQFKRKLRALVVAVHNFSETTTMMQSSRDELVYLLGEMSEKSPIQAELAGELDAKATNSLEGIRLSNGTGKTVNQVATEWEQRHEAEIYSLSVLQQWQTTQAFVNEQEFKKHIEKYVINWEKTVTELVDKDSKSVRKLQVNRSHYEKKVEGMRKRESILLSKGKSSPVSQKERLERNETKLKEAFAVHELEAGKLCVLIEAAVHEGWRELSVLAKAYMKWESNRVGRENDIYSRIPRILETMKSKTTKPASKSGPKKKGKKAKAAPK